MRTVFIIMRIPDEVNPQGGIEHVDGDSEAVAAWHHNPENFMQWLQDNGWHISPLPEPISSTHERFLFRKD